VKKDLLSVTDPTPSGAAQLIEEALVMKRGDMRCLLPWRSVALVFEKPSLVPRVSFDLASKRSWAALSLHLTSEVDGQREPVAGRRAGVEPQRRLYRGSGLQP
jgi:ornithine carbamoyltransferase